MIKVWDLESLRVYQKVELSIAISEMNLSSTGLLAISKEKGYLSLYRFEGYAERSSNSHWNVIDVQQYSNNLFIQASNMQENLYYKLSLSNRPKIFEHSRKPNHTGD